MPDLAFTLNAHALGVMLLTLVALGLFTRSEIPLETSSLFVLVLLCLGFELFPFEAEGESLHAIAFFSGFGHEALVAVVALMIIGQGLARTGALEPVGRFLAKLWVNAPALSFLLTLVLGAALSAFVNNVPIVILLLPILSSVSLRTKTPSSRLLMPMGFATLIGGMATTIGTSTNLLVVSVAASMGVATFSMFDFALPVVMAAGLAVLYLWFLVPRILPERASQFEDTSPRIFSAALNVPEDSFAAGKTVKQLVEKTEGQMRVSYLRRGEDLLAVPHGNAKVKARDQLLVSDTRENLKSFEKMLGAELYSGHARVDEEHPLEAEGQQLAEVVVTQGSPLERTSLARTRFADRYQLVTLALHRRGRASKVPRQDIANMQLAVGDILLVQGASEQISKLKKSGDLLVLDGTADLPHTEKAPLAMLIITAVVLTAALGILPIAISALCGVLLMVFSKCLSWREAGEALNAQIILIVAASLALGSALTETGATAFLAESFVSMTAGIPGAMQLSALMLLMAVLTNIVSNNAAAVIGTPIAVTIAAQQGLPAEPYVLAVLFGANMSYVTPMSYKTNLLVMSAGGYTFNDFVKVGVPLTLIMWLSLSFLLPLFYGLL